MIDEQSSASGHDYASNRSGIGLALFRGPGAAHVESKGTSVMKNSSHWRHNYVQQGKTMANTMDNNG